MEEISSQHAFPCHTHYAHKNSKTRPTCIKCIKNTLKQHKTDDYKKLEDNTYLVLQLSREI